LTSAGQVPKWSGLRPRAAAPDCASPTHGSEQSVLNAIIEWSLRNRLVVLAGAAVFVVLGLLSVGYLGIDAFPDTTPVQVQVNTFAPSLAPEEVERQITFPVEQAISGLPRLQPTRSLSKFGLSQVVVTFEDGTDIYFARQLVNERLGTVELPTGIERPKMGPVATGLGEVFHYLVSSKKRNLTDLRTLQDWTIKPALRTVPGTAEINGWGGFNRQYQVRIDPDRLLAYDFTFGQVAQAVRDNNLNVGGGSITRSGEMLLVHGIGRTNTVEEIRDGVIKAVDGVPVRIRDVATAEEGHEQPTGAVSADAAGEVVLGLGFLIMGENSHTVTTGLKNKLDEVKKNLPDDVRVEPVYLRTDLVNQVIDTVRRNLFEGGLLVVAVLFVFLGNLRAGLVVALAIPLSVLFAFCGMLRFGISASLLSLGALDFGLVVDSSVVMIENVMRHLADGESGRNRVDVVRDAALEVRVPTMFGELIIMIVYLPILTLEGVEGKMFRPMALTVIFALIGSLILSLTVIPVLASLLLPRKVTEGDPWLIRLARRCYRPVLHASLRHRSAVLLTAAGALAVAAIVARGLGTEFVPRLAEGSLVVNITRLPGTSLEEAVRVNSAMEKTLLAAFPDEVSHVWSRCGTAEVATDPMGPEETDFFITLTHRDRWTKVKTQEEIEKGIREMFADMPGQKINVTQPIEQRIQEMNNSGARTKVVVKVFGDDFDVLEAKANEVQAVLRSVDGAVDVSTEQLTGQPVLRVQLRQDQLARYGVSAREVLDLVEALSGKPVGDVIEGQLRFPLAVWLPERYRASPTLVGSILLSTASGQRLPLSELATVKLVEGKNKISRESGQRRAIVQCNVAGRDLGGFVAEARQAVDEKVQLPPGRYRFEWGGEFENFERASRRLWLVVPAALALIFVLLYITYNRLGEVLLVFTAVPFALVGGLWSLWVRDMPFSISAGVGFIALSGVSVLNSMVLVSFIRHLREKGMALDDAVEEATLTRLRPVLMTALVASLGFVPMALSTGVGAEVQRPLATVVIGGVISSTLLTLLVLPVLYDLFGHLLDYGPARSAESPSH
jgi:cobalt-zinc-cadmium resistance protein CzcA